MNSKTEKSIRTEVSWLREIAGDGDEDHADEDDAAANCGS